MQLDACGFNKDLAVAMYGARDGLSQALGGGGGTLLLQIICDFFIARIVVLLLMRCARCDMSTRPSEGDGCPVFHLCLIHGMHAWVQHWLRGASASS